MWFAIGYGCGIVTMLGASAAAAVAALRHPEPLVRKIMRRQMTTMLSVAKQEEEAS